MRCCSITFCFENTELFVAPGARAPTPHLEELCGKRAIAISFAFYAGVKFTDEEVVAASEVACNLVKQLWDNWPEGVDLFNVNVPILPLELGPPKVCLTEIHRITHGPFFKSVQSYRLDYTRHARFFFP